MADGKCRRCDRAADSGGYCGSCADGILAKALNPRHGGRRRKGARPEPPAPARLSGQPRLFR